MIIRASSSFMAHDIQEVIDVDADSSDIELRGCVRNSVTSYEYNRMRDKLRQGPQVISLISDDELEGSDSIVSSGVTLLGTSRGSESRASLSISQSHDVNEQPRNLPETSVKQISTKVLSKRTSPLYSSEIPPTKRQKHGARNPTVVASRNAQKHTLEEDIPCGPIGSTDFDHGGTPERKKRRRMASSVDGPPREYLVPDRDISILEQRLNNSDHLDDYNSSCPGKGSVADSSSDSEDDYRSYHAGLDMDVTRNWRPMPEPKTLSPPPRDDMHLASGLATLSLSTIDTGTMIQKRMRGRIDARSHNTASSVSMSDMLKSPCKRFVWAKLRTGLDHEHGRVDSHLKLYNHLSKTHTIATAPWSVNRIRSCGGFTAIASSVLGGGQDDELDGRVAPYNREGTLTVWCNNKAHVIHAHKRNGGVQTHFYNVNDIQWNPTHRTRLVSSGADGTLQVWDCAELVEGGEAKLVKTVRYNGCEPHGLLFKPQGSLLATEGSDGYVYLLNDTPECSDSGQTGLPLAPDIGHLTTDVVWGRDTSSHMIFASSASQDEDDYTGFHKAFDARTRKLICEFDAQEAGHRLAIDETGHRLMLAVELPEDSYFLRQFDVRRRMKHTQQKVELEPFVGSGRAELNRISFSPDGIYLVIPRSDNSAHVYDGRFLGRGPLNKLNHEGGTRTVEDRYGVVEACWVQGQRHGLGLITGGNDGTVRLWDVRRAPGDPQNGAPIAQCDYDIAHFAAGDLLNGEKPLVVGEHSGRVTIFGREEPHDAPNFQEF